MEKHGANILLIISLQTCSQTLFFFLKKTSFIHKFSNNWRPDLEERIVAIEAQNEDLS